MTTQMGDEPYPFDWSRLVPCVVHPVKVTIIEAVATIGRPLSPSELHEVLDHQFSLSLISHHVKSLAKFQALTTVGPREKVRGATKTRYFFAETRP